MACAPCQAAAAAAGGTAGSGLWVNVKSDGTPTKAMTKAEATDSARANGGYIRAA